MLFIHVFIHMFITFIMHRIDDALVASLSKSCSKRNHAGPLTQIESSPRIDCLQQLRLQRFGIQILRQLQQVDAGTGARQPGDIAATISDTEPRIETAKT